MTTRPIYYGSAGGVNINNETPDHGVGFGMGDFGRMQSEGFDAQSVLDYLSSWGGRVGPNAQSALTKYAADQRAADQAARDKRINDRLAAAMAYTPPPPPDPPIINIPPPAPTVPAPMSIAGNTAGVQRKKSRAEKSGRTSSGTNQFNRSMYISPVAPLNNLNV